MTTHHIQTSSLSYQLFNNPGSAPFWLLIRLYVGYEWFMAGYEKLINPVWFGASAGAALNGFTQGALAKTAGLHPDVSGWYAAFLQSTVLPNVMVWSNLIVVGELMVGLGLIVGLFTGVAAFFGGFMNLNFLLAGTVSTNPVLFVLAIGLVLARRVAGRIGLDHYAAPYLRRLPHATGLRS
ncbi:MAG: DoxX family membrane protein [Candidatus Paceibacterota bacterium]